MGTLDAPRGPMLAPESLTMVQSQPRMSPGLGLARKSRTLKIAGLSAMAIGLVPLMLFGERLGTVEWLRNADSQTLALVTIGWLAAAEVVAFGVILLLAGLKDVPLLTSARAMRGALAKLAGASLLIVIFGLVATYDGQGIPAEWIPRDWARHVAVPEEWAEVFVPIALLIVIPLFRLAVNLMRAGWKYDALSADELRAQDPRPPVLYLRSFRDDGRLSVIPGTGPGRYLAWLFSWWLPYNVTTPEQALADALKSVGPVIAIGKPGEPLPELGAARMYVDDSVWRTTVDDLMRSAALVVIQSSDTPNLLWEVEHAIRVASPHRVVIASFGDSPHIRAFDGWFSTKYGRPQPVHSDTSRDAPRLGVIERWTRKARIGKMIYFGTDRAPYEEAMYMRASAIDLYESVVRRYHPPVRLALRRVLKALRIPTIQWRTQTTAVMLALCGGIVGLHHFYLGDRRKGIRYLAFCWALVPLFLGLVDAVRMSLLESREFSERHVMRRADVPQAL